MDVWMSHCRKESKCADCPEKIKTGQPMVVGKMYKAKGQMLRWPVMLRWHPDCWIRQGLASLEKRPYVPAGNRGRKRLVLSPEDKKMRQKLLNRRGSYFFRLRAAAELGDVDKLIKIISRMEKLSEEIKNYGGVPKSWLVSSAP